MGGAESMTAVSKQRKWYVHKKKQAVQKDSLTQPCLGPFDHELKTSKLSHAVLAGRRETTAKIGEMKSSQRNVRLEFAHDDGVMPELCHAYMRRMLRLVFLWLCVDVDLWHGQVLEMVFALVQYSAGYARSKRHRNPCMELHLSVHRYIYSYSSNDL